MFFSCPVSDRHSHDDIDNQYYECFYTHSRIGTDLSGVEHEDFYNALYYHSVLPEDFFTNPELYSDNFDKSFLKACGLTK